MALTAEYMQNEEGGRGANGAETSDGAEIGGIL